MDAETPTLIVDGASTISTLKVTVGDLDHLDRRSRIETAQAGDELEDAQPVLYFGSYTDLGRLLNPMTLKLLDKISEHEPQSIREAAELVDRDYELIRNKLSELESFGIVEFEAGGDGRAKKPTMVYDRFVIEIQFSRSD